VLLNNGSNEVVFYISLFFLEGGGGQWMGFDKN